MVVNLAEGALLRKNLLRLSRSLHLRRSLLKNDLKLYRR